MKAKPDYLKLVINNTVLTAKKNKVWWWRKMAPLQVLRVPVSLMALIAFTSGVVLSSVNQWHSVANMWALSSILIFILWYIEYQMRKDLEVMYDLYKTED